MPEKEVFPGSISKIHNYRVRSNRKNCAPKSMEGCGECDDEAMRVVAIMPRWKPARLNGKLVKTYFNIPFSFKVQRQTSCLAERDARSKASVYYATANMGNRFIQLIQGGYLSTETKIVSEKPDLYENKKGFDP